MKYLLATTALLAMIGTASADSCWKHNGSLVRLEASGNDRNGLTSRLIHCPYSVVCGASWSYGPSIWDSCSSWIDFGYSCPHRERSTRRPNGLLNSSAP